MDTLSDSSVASLAAEFEAQGIGGTVTALVFQLAVIIFTVRIFGKLAAKLKISSVLGELVAGIIIGPFALGAVSLPGFENGIFPLFSQTLAVHPALYAFAQIASIILLFSSGLETNLSLFIKYSVSGGIIGLGGVIVSFVLGDSAGIFILNFIDGDTPSFMDIRCLFLGIMSTATSVGITARILSDRKKMDSPEGVTILAAAVFDDVLGIVLLAVVLGIVSASSGGAMPSGGQIGVIALKAFAVWFAATAVFILFAKRLAKFVRLFGGTVDFSIAALGVALVLAGIFEKQGLAMIIGAYTTGLALSKTDIAPIIQDRLYSLYKFFVPVFFAVTGMSVDVTQFADSSVLICGLAFTVICILSKLIGCGGPALALGFNLKGGFRIGAGMIPRGEVALIIAGIGLGAGIVEQKLFGIVIMMTLLTTLFAPPILNISLSLKGRGTRKKVDSCEACIFEWDFGDPQVATLVMDLVIRDLRAEGFYVQIMSITDGIFQARKGDISLSGKVEETRIVIEASEKDMGFVKGEVYEIILRLKKSMESIDALSDTSSLQYGFTSAENRVGSVLFRHLDASCIKISMTAQTREEAVAELVDLLVENGNIEDRENVISAVLEREKAMSTGVGNGIALPHGKTDAVRKICVAIGIKQDGIDFNSVDGKKAEIIVLIVSPNEGTSPHMRIMAAVTGALMHEDVRRKILTAQSPKEVIDILKEAKN